MSAPPPRTPAGGGERAEAARTVLAVACVALLSVTAGCGGLVGEGTPTREPYDVDPTATETPTATQTASPGFRAAVENHTRALRSVGNFTIRQSERVGGSSEPPPDPVAERLAVDLTADRYAWSRRVEGGAFVVFAYQNATGVYRRGDEGFLNVTATAGVTPERVAASLMDAEIRSLLEFPFERDGTAVFDGEVMARYTASDPGRFRGFRKDFRRITAFEATALVDDRGIVRKVTYTIRGQLWLEAGYAETATVSIVDVGGTDVPRSAALANVTTVDGGANRTDDG